MPALPLRASSQVATVSGTSAKFTNAMSVNRTYTLNSTTDIWWTIGATGGAAVAATANNYFLKAGCEVALACEDATNGFVHVIQVSAGGTAVLTCFNAP